tara:strand:- start:231 stop:530 length:300 start_codon:yes stop_codon:yes gene_type:complete
MPTNREEYLKRHKLKGSQSLSQLARTSKVPLKILQQVYNKGIGAYKTQPSSVRNVKGVKGGPGKKLSKEQWAYARVYSFLNKLEGKRKLNHDLDLAKKI